MHVQASGLKLRINVVDTVIIQSGRIGAWFYTSRDGVVCRAGAHELVGQAVFQKLAGMAHMDARNPYGYIGLAHYDGGISRPLKLQELRMLVSYAQICEKKGLGMWPRKQLPARSLCLACC